MINLLLSKLKIRTKLSESSVIIITTLFIFAICILCDVFVFNARHFVTRWGDGIVDMSYPDIVTHNMTRDNVSGLFSPDGGEEIERIGFYNLNRRIVTVYIDAVFSEGAKLQPFKIDRKSVV